MLNQSADIDSRSKYPRLTQKYKDVHITACAQNETGMKMSGWVDTFIHYWWTYLFEPLIGYLAIIASTLGLI